MASSESDFDDVDFSCVPAATPAPKRQRRVPDMDGNSEDGYASGGDSGGELDWSDQEDDDEERAQADTDQVVRDARAAAAGAPIYNPGGVGEVLSSAFAWIRKETADELFRGIYGVSDLVAAVFYIDGHAETFYRIRADNPVVADIRKMQKERKTAIFFAHPHVGIDAVHYRPVRRHTRKQRTVPAHFRWAKAYRRDKKSRNESLLHKQAKSIATYYDGEIHCYVACNHPQHRNIVGPNIACSKLHLVFGPGQRFEEVTIGCFRYDSVRSNAASREEVTAETALAALEVQKSCPNSDAKRENHESDKARFPMAQVDAGELVSEYGRVRALESDLERAEAVASRGDKDGARLVAEARAALEAGKVVRVHHHPKSTLAPNWCHMCSEENRRRDAERAEREAAEKRLSAEHEADGEEVHARVGQKRTELEAQQLADWSLVETFSENGKYLRGRFRWSPSRGSDWTRCFMEDGFSSLKVLVRTDAIGEFETLNDKEVYVMLRAVPERGGPGVVQFVRHASELKTEVPFARELEEFESRVHAEVVAARAATRPPPGGAASA